jgi:hypothetical protein
VQAGRWLRRAACSGWPDRSSPGGELFEAHVTAALGPAFCRDGRLSRLWPEAATSTYNVVGFEESQFIMLLLFSIYIYQLRMLLSKREREECQAGGGDKVGVKSNKKRRKGKKDTTARQAKARRPAPCPRRKHGGGRLRKPIQVLLLEGGNRTHNLFRFTTRPRRISPQYR